MTDKGTGSLLCTVRNVQPSTSEAEMNLRVQDPDEISQLPHYRLQNKEGTLLATIFVQHLYRVKLVAGWCGK